MRLRKSEKILIAEIIFVLLSLSVIFVLAVPLITVHIQSIGEIQTNIHAVVFYVYNPSNTPYYNYSLRMVLNTSQFIDPEALLNGMIFSDINVTTFYYYWIQYKSPQKIVLWVKIPYIPANNYVFVVMWYGDISQTIAQEYDNPYKTFLYFDNLSTDITTAWNNTYIGLEPYNVDYNFSKNIVINTNYDYVKIRHIFHEGYEGDLWTLRNFSYSQPVIIDFVVEPKLGESRIIGVGVVSPSKNTYELIEIDNTSGTYSFYSTDSFLSLFYGTTSGSQIAPAPIDQWIEIEMNVYGFFTVSRAVSPDLSTTYFSWTITGYTAPQTFKLWLEQRNIEGSGITRTRNVALVKYIFIRYGSYNDQIYYGVVGRYTFVT